MKRLTTITAAACTAVLLTLGAASAAAHNHTELGPDGEQTPKAKCWQAWLESDARTACSVPEIEAVGKNRCRIKVDCFNDHVWPTPPPTANDLAVKLKKVRKLKNCSGEVKKKC